MKDTYQLCIYQEQMTEIIHVLAGWSLADCDEARKHMAKKTGHLKDLKDKFIEGCINHSKMSKSRASGIWKQLEDFGNYSFNKCFHSKTQILLPDGNTPTIRELFNIDYRGPVCSINPNNNKYQQSYVEDIKW